VALGQPGQREVEGPDVAQGGEALAGVTSAGEGHVERAPLDQVRQGRADVLRFDPG